MSIDRTSAKSSARCSRASVKRGPKEVLPLAFRGGAATARAFTLLELLTSMAILGLMIVMLFSVFEQVNKAWLNGESRVETFTDARAILDFMSRELSQAIATTNIAFYGTATTVDFVAPVNANPQNFSDLCGVGYSFEQYAGSTWTLKITRHLIQPSTVAAASLIYSPTWTNNFTSDDTPATLAANSVVGLEFQYYDASGSPSTTWSTPNKLPTAIAIGLMNVDSRTAVRMNQFTPTTLPPSITNSTLRTFSTVVYLPNTSP